MKVNIITRRGSLNVNKSEINCFLCLIDSLWRQHRSQHRNIHGKLQYKNSQREEFSFQIMKCSPRQSARKWSDPDFCPPGGAVCWMASSGSNVMQTYIGPTRTTPFNNQLPLVAKIQKSSYACWLSWWTLHNLETKSIYLWTYKLLFIQCIFTIC